MKTTLVISCDIPTAREIKDSLAREGHEVFWASTLKEGARWLERYECDGVVMDADVVDGDFSEAIAHLHCVVRRPAVVVVARQSCHWLEKDVRAAGATAFALLPVEMDSVVAALANPFSVPSCLRVSG